LNSGAVGFALIIVPSLDRVIYKMSGNNGQYDAMLTGWRSRRRITCATSGGRFHAKSLAMRARRPGLRNMK
jgi:hypothetical protein